MAKKDKRVTIYDLAKALQIAPSSVSKALNDSPLISKKIKLLVAAKAKELNYKHNTNAANLRRGSSKTIGIVVPKINESFFANIIAGAEEICALHHHSLIICQSNESYEKEVLAVETLIRQNVDCILISLSLETTSFSHLEEIGKHHIHLIQFDRVTPHLKSHTVENDNTNIAYKAVKHLIDEGYKKIAFLGGPKHLPIYGQRKEGYLKAIKEANLIIPDHFIVDDAISKEKGESIAIELLNLNETPDAFFCVSDYTCLGILNALKSLNLTSPDDIGIFGFANENFTSLISPTLSSIDQMSILMGKEAINIYFDTLLKDKEHLEFIKLEVKGELIFRKSSLKSSDKNTL